jgi:hypothetical protein
MRPTAASSPRRRPSLPERLGGPRNWDYRFCWLRDATLTLLSLMNRGYYDEARAWRDWLLRAAAGSPDQLQIMYGVTGKRWLAEREVPWLDGYENSKPVRVGNAAADQLQLDVYGEVMDALHHARVGRSPVRGGVGVSALAARTSRDGLANPRRWHLGSARRTPSLHLEGDGLGRV